MKLAQKVCVITGAGSGIGQATALLFAREGAKVVAADLKSEAADETVRLIRKAAGEALAVQVDVADSTAVQRMFQEALRAYGRVDVLVNNAGFGIAATVEETAEEDWDRLMAVNVRGVYLGCKYVIPIMRKQKGGVIISTASAVATMGIRERAAYCASKGAVAALTRAMAIDHWRDGIRVNCIAPGTIESPYFTRIFAESPNAAGLKWDLEARQIMNRLGTPEEIAQGMLYLASADSSFVTGASLVVDGGMSAW